jgi:hypothetical protein
LVVAHTVEDLEDAAADLEMGDLVDPVSSKRLSLLIAVK